MPVFSYRCSKCGREFRRIKVKIEEFSICDCGDLSVRYTKTVPGISVMEHLDNGVMARAIDRPADAVRIFTERAEQHKREVLQDIDEDDLDEINHDGDPVG